MTKIKSGKVAPIEALEHAAKQAVNTIEEEGTECCIELKDSTKECTVELLTYIAIIVFAVAWNSAFTGLWGLMSPSGKLILKWVYALVITIIAIGVTIFMKREIDFGEADL
eukprot:TRINITY_DN8492_c0_g1_i1.p1 TRINITY_DN8492_c0_g1~~TRINITY_DN8492_c0_g1_i1.p1  ORF type:complete len:111 (-),score=19.84 TRINITY_DN8492_c0_g1_i1:83-415(-)